MIQINNLNKKYGNKTILNNLTLTISPGKVCGIMGENGAGKSTLFQCITGLTKYNGEITFKTPLAMGYLNDSPFYYSCIKGIEYVEFCIKARGCALNYCEIEKLNELFCLPLNEYASEYSMGMKKRLAFMALLLQQNDFYILDEPFNGLDLVGCILVKKIVKELRNQNKTILISSHIISSLTDLCDNIYYINKGTIAKDYSGFSIEEIEEDIISSI